MCCFHGVGFSHEVGEITKGQFCDVRWGFPCAVGLGDVDLGCLSPLVGGLELVSSVIFTMVISHLPRI
jgi:hypothetical protein